MIVQDAYILEIKIDLIPFTLIILALAAIADAMSTVEIIETATSMSLVDIFHSNGTHS